MGIGPRVAHAVRTLALDGAAVEIIERLHRREIPYLLLKGPVTARWLYGPDEARPYVDIDLFVPESESNRSTSVLHELGFEPVVLRRHPEPNEGRPWLRPRDGAAVDLHSRLWGVRATGDELWRVLSERADTMPLGSTVVQIPRPAVRAWLVAAHAAKHGRNVLKGMDDLRRAVAQLDDVAWREAAGVAERLGAVEAFSSGLRLLPDGAQLAHRLDLPAPVGREYTLRAGAKGMGIAEIDAFLARRGVSAKLLFLVDRAAPTRTFMRRMYPLARRGRWGLIASYAWRPFDLAWRTVKGLIPWWAARRKERSGRSRAAG